MREDETGGLRAAQGSQMRSYREEAEKTEVAE
jgi:hypothetical protein